MKRHRALLLVFLVSFCILLTSCGTELSYGTNDQAIEEKSEPQQIEIKDLTDAWDTILNKSTKAFIGGHPIDEGFLANITGIYGDHVIEEIASYANFETPEIWYTLTGKSIHVLWYEYCQQTGIQNYSLENVYVFNSNSDDEVVMDFTGDFTLAENVATTSYMDSQLNGIEDCFSYNLIAEMHSADVLMVNNEFAYTSRGEALFGKAYTFRADPSRVSLLETLGVDIVGIANNHVYDYDEVGFLDTVDTLNKADVPFVGAGANIEEACKPVYIIAGGRKIAIVAATQIERTLNYTKEATGTSPGVLKCLHPETFCKVISEAKENADFVIAFVHWGTEGNVHYGSDQTSLARHFVEAGADAIIGGHTHCLQTVEYMDDVPIYYSLGNYYFSTTGNMPSAYSTGIAQLHIKTDGTIESFFLPCQFDSGVTSLLTTSDAAYSDIINTLNDMSETAIIEADGHISKKQTE